MATTDARAGFRLPWSSDRQSNESSDGESTDPHAAAATGWPSEDATSDPATPETAVDEAASVALVDAVDAVGAVDAVDAEDRAETPTVAEEPAPPAARVEAAAPVAEPAPVTPAPKPSAKKPSKFMADLTKAMQAAAEDARTRALGQLQVDAKTQVEVIHGRSSTEAASLRRQADDDVAAVREWSKAEIARIREETETKITDRKTRLESQIEEHAAVIEREIDAVQKTVAAFEDEMAAFFSRLLAEEDPSRFATMAENLPEPPSFDGLVHAEDEDDEPAETAEPAGGAVENVETVEAGEAATADVEMIGTSEPEAATDVDLDAAPADATPIADAAEGGELDRESAFAAIQAAAEAAASAEVAADAAARAEAVADVAIEIMGNHDDAEDDADPRFAALGLSPDYDAAEAEALADAGSSDEEIPLIGDDALAARLAGLVPGKGKSKADDAAATQVVVVGLVSVASIASFKRHLGRVAGVQAVGVSSGPDGEFVFNVSHGAGVVLRDAIPSLPSFQARVTGSADGVVHVTAHDPESDS
ncbi:MAG: hypothetical protein QOF49_2275 [Chloroflexota bacterium]|nr:hypothetical protein [Chloroflexota bacterium]